MKKSFLVFVSIFSIIHLTRTMQLSTYTEQNKKYVLNHFQMKKIHSINLEKAMNLFMYLPLKNTLRKEITLPEKASFITHIHKKQCNPLPLILEALSINPDVTKLILLKMCYNDEKIYEMFLCKPLGLALIELYQFKQTAKKYIKNKYNIQKICSFSDFFALSKNEAQILLSIALNFSKGNSSFYIYKENTFLMKKLPDHIQKSDYFKDKKFFEEIISYRQLCCLSITKIVITGIYLHILDKNFWILNNSLLKDILVPLLGVENIITILGLCTLWIARPIDFLIDNIKRQQYIYQLGTDKTVFKP